MDVRRARCCRRTWTARLTGLAAASCCVVRRHRYVGYRSTVINSACSRRRLMRRPRPRRRPRRAIKLVRRIALVSVQRSVVEVGLRSRSTERLVKSGHCVNITQAIA